MWRPPIPLRLGSTNWSESFHIGLVKSTTASSLPKSGLCSSLLVPQHSRSQRSSASGRRRISATAGPWRYNSGKPLEGVLNPEGDVVDVGQLVRQHGNGTGKNPDRLELAVVQVYHVLLEGGLAKAVDETGQYRVRKGGQRGLHPARKG
jgi:hypothetical protein